MYLTRNQAWWQHHRGFESHLLRHVNRFNEGLAKFDEKLPRPLPLGFKYGRNSMPLFNVKSFFNFLLQMEWAFLDQFPMPFLGIPPIQ